MGSTEDKTKVAAGEPSVPTSRGALLTAIGVSILLGAFIPYGRYALYPFTLLATWVHEMGHGVAGLLSGGSFESLDVFANASGLAHVRAPQAAHGFVSFGGLVAPPIAGASILLAARGAKRARVVLVALAALLVFSLAIWVRSITGWIVLPVIAALIGAFAYWGSPREILFLAQFIGLRFALDTVTRIDYAFTSKVTVDGVERSSDISNVADSWGGPMFLWSLLVSVISFSLVGVGLWAAFRSPRVPKQQPAKANA